MYKHLSKFKCLYFFDLIKTYFSKKLSFKEIDASLQAWMETLLVAMQSQSGNFRYVLNSNLGWL